jgi:hypothetical protein
MPEQDRWDEWWETDEGSADEARAFDKIMKHAEMTDAMRRCMHREPTLRKPNAHHNPNDTGKAPIPQRTFGNATLGAAQVQSGTGDRILVRIESIRKRLLDEDNLVSKYHTDLCRYAGLIPSDAPGICKIETTQRKAAKGEAEHTLITITYPL